MRSAGLAPLLSLPCLLLVALLMRVWNLQHETRTPVPPVETPLVAASKSDERGTASLRKELKAALLRYRSLRGAAQRQATFGPAWERWQTSIDGEAVDQRLAQFRSWSDFSVDSVEQRSSGFVVVMLSHGDQRLKAWVIAGKSSTQGWRLAGLVCPTSQPEAP